VLTFYKYILFFVYIGGVLVYIAGECFSNSTQVLIDGQECTLVYANYSLITCLTPPNVSS